MIEKGIVVKGGLTAKVRVDKKDECAKCGACLFSENAKYVEFNAKNQAGAKEGDEVVISTFEGGKLLGALLVFGVPLVIICAAAFFALAVFKNEILLPIIAVIGVVLWFFVLALLDKKIKKFKRFSTEIVEIVDKKEIENDNKRSE